jgi:hypothetical protein
MARSGIDKRRHRRHPRRLQCKLVVDSREYTAFVLDLSVSGLFIQTHARPRVGLRLPLVLTHAKPPLELSVEVVRAKRVPPNLLAVVKGGIGVRVVSAPSEYDRLLAELGIGENAEPFELEAPAGPGRRFRVHAAQIGGARSRRVDVTASGADEAPALALEELGSDWKVIRVEML